MPIKVKSLPHISHFRTEESGIKRVVEAYFKYLPDYGIELVKPDAKRFDLIASHAGMGDGTADVSHLHGLYWTADHDDTYLWEYKTNARIVNDLRVASQITVPSHWVAETLQRDMRLNPHVIGHGIEWQEWQHDYPTLKYILWNKNRIGDVCTPKDVNRLAKDFPNIQFISTFGNGENIKDREYDEIIELLKLDDKPNYFNIGLKGHHDMKKLIQQAGVYLSTTSETFGIGILEAMAAGVPVLGYAKGGILDLIQHGVNGYLAQDYDDLCEGLVYCINYHKILGDNSRELVKNWTWDKQVEKVAGVYRLALNKQEASVSVVIPVYNKSKEQVLRAVESCLNQTLKPKEIIIVNDGSDEDYSDLQSLGAQNYYPVRYIKQQNQGVAIARNNGISYMTSKYVCCLDADDWLDKSFLKVCVNALESDKALHIAYTKLQWHMPNGKTGVSDWPGEWDFDKQVYYRNEGDAKGLNQVPTCCVFSREMFNRLGGYRARYCPQGQGVEDAEFWTRAGAYGFKAELVTQEALFHYSGGGNTSSKEYVEIDWLAWHPWSNDGQHPFISYARPVNLSHPVRQYDEPMVSIIIPVGPGHEKELINALDSVEAQTFRKWECIVIWDIDHGGDDYKYIQRTYPYIKNVVNWIDSNWGAGKARNKGVDIARAPLLLFLDADDTLHPEALVYMLDAWNNEQSIIYTDYVGQAFIDDELARKLNREDRLQSYNPHDGEAIISYKAFDYDCRKVLEQPSDPPYIWCNISCLVPRKWHDEIGGFDESMETWEDWDYWIRHSFNGKCFYHLEKELLRYRFYTGQRREIAASDRQKAQYMIKLLTNKYEGIEKMGCPGGCGGSKAQVPQISVAEKAAILSDNNYVKARYIGSAGNHHIIGAFTTSFDPGVPSRKIGPNQWKHYYGYHKKGWTTYIHKEDYRQMIGKWELVPEIRAPKIETEKPIPEPIAPPELIEPPVPLIVNDALDLQTIPGINAKIAKEMQSLGLTTEDAILAADVEGLVPIKGIAEQRAKRIIGYLKDKNK